MDFIVGEETKKSNALRAALRYALRQTPLPSNLIGKLRDALNLTRPNVKGWLPADMSESGVAFIYDRMMLGDSMQFALADWDAKVARSRRRLEEERLGRLYAQGWVKGNPPVEDGNVFLVGKVGETNVYKLYSIV